MKNPKANFENLYATYSSRAYVEHLVRDLNYYLPFLSMERLKRYSRSLLPQSRVQVTVIGAGHGLDAAVLKFDQTAEDILARWTDDSTMTQAFPTSHSGYEVTLVDVQAEPLRFASDVKLADHSFVTDLNQPFPREFEQHLLSSAEIVSAVGVTSYLGVEGLEKIIQTAFTEGSAKLLYASVLKYLEVDSYMDAFRKHGLTVLHLGDVEQRSYKGQDEKNNVLRTLKQKGLLSAEDQKGLVTSLILAYKEEAILGEDTLRKGASQTLVVVDQESRLLGSTFDGSFYEIERWPHPWHIALSAENAEDRGVMSQLTKLHIGEAIQPGDILTTITNSQSDHLVNWANVFMGEYEVHAPSSPKGESRQTLRRVEPTNIAHIIRKAPTSTEDLDMELSEFGHVLLRTGEAIDEGLVLRLLAGTNKPMNYRYGTTSRKKIEGSSTALQVTPWPNEHHILPHSEMSYHTEFPTKLSFLCQKPAECGGETSMYDCARALTFLPPKLQRKVRRHHTIFHRRYVKSLAHERYASWQQILGENATHEALIEHFRAMGFDCEIIQVEEDGATTTVLETRLARPIVYEHQGRLCLHASIVGFAPYWYDEVWPGKKPPFTVTWDDGEPISMEELRQMERSLLASRISYGNWQKHDVIILDNLRIAHGRLPFIGERSIGALMARPAQFIHVDGQWHVESID